MIESKNLLPKIYSTSHDFLLFEALIDVAFNSIDAKIPALKALHSPENCFQENLSSLAKCFDLETTDRQLLKQYRLMVKSKGTQKSIEAAIFFCGAKRISKPEISSKVDEFRITYKAIYDQFDQKLFKTLMSRLLPVNCQIQVLPVEELEEIASSTLALS